MTTTAAPAPTTARPEPPPSSARFLVGLLGIAGALAAGASLFGSIGLIWGLATGVLVFVVLRWLGVTDDPTDGLVLAVAGAGGVWWFGEILAGRTGTIDLAISVRASFGWLLFGATLGYVLKRAKPQLTWPAIVIIALAWAVGSVAATQMGTIVGYLVELRRREVEAGLIQGLGSVFYGWASLIIVAIGVGTAFSVYVGTPTVFSVSMAFVVSVLSFNQVGFSISEIFSSFDRLNELAKEFWPPRWEWPKSIGQEPSNVIIAPMIETFQIGIVGATIGCTAALPLSFLASRVTTPTSWGYWVAKSFMNVIRTIPDLFWAIVFTAAVGFGQPFAGALAMIMFSLAIMAKLLSETVDAIDPGPLEAARSTGARHSQAIQYAALPQVLPNYVAYALYIFELNIRASVVIGIVGAGGIGRLLDEQRNLFQWDRVMAIVIVIFVAVILIEMVSILVRRRLV